MTAPHDLLSERGLIGDLIGLPQHIPAVMATVTPGDFYMPAMAVMFAALVTLFESGHAVTPEALREELALHGNLSACGGVQGIAETVASSTGAWKKHAATVGRLAALRRVLVLAIGLKDAAMDPTSDAGTLIAEALRDLELVELPAAELPSSLISMDTLIDETESGENGVRLPWVIPGQMRAASRAMVVAPEGQGKALAIDTPVATPRGWVTMADLSVGDQVFGSSGSPVTIIAATDVMEGRPCYRVGFADGGSVIADADHQWVTIDYWGRQENRWETRERTTRELSSTVRARDGFVLNHLIERTPPLIMREAILPLDPYTFGAWLGDGTTRSGQITCADPPILERIKQAGWECSPITASKYGWTIHRQGEDDRRLSVAESLIASGVSERGAEREVGIGRGGLSHSRKNPRKRRTSRGSLFAVLKSMGVLGKKHIPLIYMRSSLPQREALLQGLMDTDGSVCGASVELTLCDPLLASDAVELVRSLGYRPSANWSDATLNGRVVGRRCRIKFTPDRAVFHLPRKRDQMTDGCHFRSVSRYVNSVDVVESVPVRCIQVDAADGVFLAGETLIRTHNSLLIRQMAMCCAQGVHPLMFGPIPSVRTLLVDLENPAEAITETAGPMRTKLRTKRGDLYRHDECWVWHEPGGIDLRKPRWRAEFDRVLDAVQPDLVCLGPLYKAFRTSVGESDEQATGELQNVLDDFRIRYGFALVLEHHAPKGAAGSRDLVPFGSSLWLRWPEFGLKLVPSDNGSLEIKRWRGDRVQVNWPDRLDRGGINGWPWVGYWERGMDNF